MRSAEKHYLLSVAQAATIYPEAYLKRMTRILREKKKALDRDFTPYRINHLTWWKEELANEEEMEEGRKNLRQHDYSVDYIVTHCCSTGTQNLIGGNALYAPDRETDYLEFIKNYANYKKWFFGHYHENININDKEILLYEQIIRIA